ncbi:MAG: TolC family protein [Flavobacteriales bacterium]|nr:TolC family protein [Flavobacteriales bacterium]
MNPKFEKILIDVYALYTRNGIKSTTMDDAARALGISKKTLYVHVNDKADLVSSVIALQIKLDTEVMDEIFASGINAIEELIALRAYFNNKLAEIHPSFHYDMEKYYPESWKIFLEYKDNYILDCVINNMKKGVKEGLYRKEVNIQVIARLYTSRVDLVFDPSVFPVSEFNFPDVNVDMMDYHVRGIASDKGIKFLENNDISSIFSKTKSTIIASVIMLFMVSFSFGQAVSYSLQQAQDFALKNSAVVKNGEIDIEIAKAKIKEITSTGLPQISGEVKYNNFIDIPTQVAPARAFDPTAPEGLLVPLQFGTSNNASAGITASQLLFDGTYIVGLQAAKVYRQLSETGAKKAKLDVKESVASSYYMALMADENVKIYKRSLDNVKKTLNELILMLNNGLIDAQEVDQMKLTSSTMTNMYDRAVTQKNVALELLEYQMGLKGEGEISLTDSLGALMNSAEDINLLGQKLDVKSHIDYQLISNQKSLLALDVKKEKFRRLPSVAGFFTHSQNAFSNELKFSNWYPTTIVGVSANIPIFGSGMSTYRIKQATLELEKIENTRISLLKGLESGYANAHSEYNAAIKNGRVAKRSRDLAQRILDKTILKQKEGLASSMEVTQANTQFVNAQGQYMNSVFGLLTSKIKLQKALNSY